MSPGKVDFRGIRTAIDLTIHLFAPLPDERFLIFVDCLESHHAQPGPPRSELIAELIDERVALEVGVLDVRWASNFCMQKRIAPVLGEKGLFLVGDAGHASSPLGGEGLNAALQDAADLAWKLALVLRGRGRQALLDSYVIEVLGIIQDSRAGSPAAALPAPDPEGDLALGRSKAMLDVSYAGSPLVGEYWGPGNHQPQAPAPGQRYPDRTALKGQLHHLLVFGPSPSGIEDFQRRWGDLVEVMSAEKAGLSTARAGVPEGGLVLVRPDGYIGYRAVPADDAALSSLDAHLETYLVPH